MRTGSFVQEANIERELGWHDEARKHCCWVFSIAMYLFFFRENVLIHVHVKSIKRVYASNARMC